MEQKAMTERERNAISFIRMLATVSIVLCHFASWDSRLSAVGQFLNVGVPVFFLISGFLYGLKDISKPTQWLLKRCLTVLIPVYLYYLVSGLLLLAIGKLGVIEIKRVLIQMLNLQGFAGGYRRYSYRTFMVP